MNEIEAIDKLSDIYGIVNEFYDIAGNRNAADTDTKKKILESMGLDVSCEDSAKKVLANYEDEASGRILEPVYVFYIGDEVLIRAVVPEEISGELQFEIVFESGQKKIIDPVLREKFVEKYFEKEIKISLFSLSIDSPPEGYHKIFLVEKNDAGNTLASADLYLCPPSCFVSQKILDSKMRGIAVQLYALNSNANSGVGDLNDLSMVSHFAAEKKLDLVGISPIHSLFPANRKHISPYSPSNRTFYNPAYLSLPDVPDWNELAEQKSAEYSELIESEKKKTLIDYDFVLKVKYEK